MKTEEISRQGYTMIFNVFESGTDFDQSDDLVELKVLTRYELHDGFGLWKVNATYAKQLKPSTYYVIATNRASAMIKFLNIVPWLSVLLSIELVTGEEMELVLGNPALNIIF